jgi:hypothetical protein
MKLPLSLLSLDLTGRQGLNKTDLPRRNLRRRYRIQTRVQRG